VDQNGARMFTVITTTHDPNSCRECAGCYSGRHRINPPSDTESTESDIMSDGGCYRCECLSNMQHGLELYRRRRTPA
jgi:hypothetical protein